MMYIYMYIIKVTFLYCFCIIIADTIADTTQVQYNMYNVHMDNIIHTVHALCMYMYMYMLPLGSAKVACVL